MEKGLEEWLKEETQGSAALISAPCDRDRILGMAGAVPGEV